MSFFRTHTYKFAISILLLIFYQAKIFRCVGYIVMENCELRRDT